MPSPRKAFNSYTASGGLAFYLLGNGKNMIGVRDGSVYTLSNYLEVDRLGPLAGSRAELAAGRQYPFAVITFADGARYYSRELIAKWARSAAKEIAEYNHLSGYVAPPPGFVPASPSPSQAPPAMAWSCRFCKTLNRDAPRCDHCGAPR